MEVLHGQTLTELLARGALGIDETLAILHPLLSALAYAHACGVVHRDLKPDNISLARDSDGVVTPKLLDFGISKLQIPEAPALTRHGEIVGTPSYMSPEQVRGNPSVDARSDIFNVGILLYEMLSGQNPFASGGDRPVLVAILEDRPAPIAGVDRGIWKVIERALEKDASARHGSVAALARALREAVAAAATPSFVPESAHLWKRAPSALLVLAKPRVRAVALGIAALGLAIGFSVSPLIMQGARADSPASDTSPAPDFAPMPFRIASAQTDLTPVAMIGAGMPPVTVRAAASAVPRPSAHSPASERHHGIRRDPGF